MGLGALFYKLLPYTRTIVVILELSSVTTVLYIISVVLLAPTSVTNTTITTSTIASTTIRPPNSQTKLLIAIGLSFAGSFTAVLTAIVCGGSSFCCCICFIVKEWRRPLLRFMMLNCNCPCYIPRPKLRFIVRLCINLVSIVLRIVGTILFGITGNEVVSSTDKTYVQILLIATAASLIFPMLILILDFYHYRIWWAYKPKVQMQSSPIKSALSAKHRRFLPYVLIERFRKIAVRKDQQCRYGHRCQDRELEHIVIFHSMDFRPQPRWSLKYPTYIGFHRTKAEYAMLIAHSDLRISEKEPQMLGFGIYFARSAEATEGKARQAGAYICAEIRMGKVLVVEFSQLRNVSNSKQWWNEYDTVYYAHQEEKKDEFCIKSPAQIVKWIIYIEPPEDKKLTEYGMDTEYNDTLCHCI